MMKEIVINKPFNEKMKIKFEKVKEKIKQDIQKDKMIKKLLKEKKYEEIYKVYGKDVYVATVPEKYLKKSIKEYLKEGRFEDIYNKFGSTYYNRYLPKMESIDKYMELNKKKIGTKSFLYQVRKKILSIVTSGILLLEGAPAVLIPALSSLTLNDNARQYSEEISLYNSKINEYANNIRKLNLNDLETIMKVLDDMWSDIKGYGSPEKDIFGYGRLDFLESGSIGVCRNMADDFTAKMNAINPNYNARNLIVNINGSFPYHLANINRNFVEQNENPQEENNENKNEENNNNNEQIDYLQQFKTDMLGNHMVSLIDIPSDGITLMVDATNPSIGIFKDGSIYTFATEDGKGLTIPALRQYTQGTVESIKYEGAVIMSHFQNNKDIELLRQKWGVVAQNKALDKVRSQNTQNASLGQNSSNISYEKTYYNDENELSSKVR